MCCCGSVLYFSSVTVEWEEIRQNTIGMVGTTGMIVMTGTVVMTGMVVPTGKVITEHVVLRCSSKTEYCLHLLLVHL